jgi:hypothetical protein
MTAPIAGRRLGAKFDLLLAGAGPGFTVVDWKTSRYRMRRERLLSRLQTRVYPYVLVEAGRAVNGGQPITPEQVELVYWFSEAPDNPERIRYTAAQHMANRDFLSGLIDTIQALDPTGLDLRTTESERCAYCVYRSFCERGVTAGALADIADLDDVGSFSFEPDLNTAEEIAL